jgi:quercetin dioxygenase-like cupin family protein
MRHPALRLAAKRALAHHFETRAGLPVAARVNFFGERSMFKQAVVCIALATCVVGTPAAQQAASPGAAPIKRTLLQKVDVPGSNYEAVTALAEIMPNANVGRHTHPGPETGYVLDGGMTLLVDGKPPLPLKAGDSYQVGPAAVHDARTGAQGAKVMVVYVVEKGKPLASPAP